MQGKACCKKAIAEPAARTIKPTRIPTAAAQSKADRVGRYGLNPDRVRLGRVDKLNPDSDAGKQHEGGEALDQLVVASSDTA